MDFRALRAVPALQDRVKTLAAATALAVAVLGSPGTAAAHVIDSPDTSLPGQTQLYAIAVPIEKQSSNTIKVEVQFPRTLVVLHLQAPAGWTVSPEKDGAGRILGAVFQGGTIQPDEFATFEVLALNPNNSADLRWTTIQSYDDGTEVQWVGAESSQFPASVTRIRSPGVEAWLQLAVGGCALVIALFALGLTVWRRNRSTAKREAAAERSSGVVRTPVDLGFRRGS